jgi:putative ABC transport system permease protein
VERFLGLVALLSLLVGGIGVAQTVRSFLASRLDALAILACLGLRPRQAFALYLAQAALLGLAGSVVGGLAGLAVQQQVPRLLGDLLPAASLPFWHAGALGRGLLLGLGTSLVFALPPLTAILRVPPLRALRRSAEPLPPSRLVLGGVLAALLGGVLALATVQGGSWALGLRFTGALLAVVTLLTAAAVGLRRLAGLLRRSRGPLWLRQGAALVAAPGSDTLPTLVALGIGVLVVLSTFLIQRHLAAALAAELPADAPTAFLLDVQPDQWARTREILEAGGATSVDSVPVVMARLASVDGRAVEELAAAAGDDGDREWALTREQRLTYLDDLPPDNELVAGAWFSPDVPNEASLEVEFAGDLGAAVGSILTFDVQGVPVEVTVTSLRRVDWRTFRINFFLVTDPETLEDAPQTILAAARLPHGREQEIQDRLVAEVPNVTLIDVRVVLEKVAGIFRRLSVGIRFLGLFTALAGIVILFGAVAAGSVRRAREVALLKTLGFTRGGVGAVFSTSFGLLGLVAGVIGALGALAVTWIVVTRGFELDWQPFPGPTGLAVVLAVLLTLLAGLAASARALARRPIEVLRDERE